MTVQNCPFDHFIYFYTWSFSGLHENWKFTCILNYTIQCITKKYDLMIFLFTLAQGRIGSPNFGGIFFQGTPKNK
jgi:hypothetical protein